MILGIRLNWIRARESADRDPRSAWDTLILNIQENFPPCPSVGYKAWSQNTSSPLKARSLKGFQIQNQLKLLKAASLFVPTLRSLYLTKHKLATCWQDVKWQISVFGLCTGREQTSQMCLCKCSQVGQLQNTPPNEQKTRVYGNINLNRKIWQANDTQRARLKWQMWA